MRLQVEVQNCDRLLAENKTSIVSHCRATIVFERHYRLDIFAMVRKVLVDANCRSWPNTYDEERGLELAVCYLQPQELRFTYS